MIDPSGIRAEIASTMHCQQLQIRMAIEYTVEDQIVERKRCFERIADDVVEVEAGKALTFGKTVRMDHHQRAELFRLCPEWSEVGIGKFAAGDIREDLGAFQPKSAHRPIEFRGRLPAVGHRNAAKTDKAVRLSRDILGDAVVENTRRSDADPKRNRCNNIETVAASQAERRCPSHRGRSVARQVHSPAPDPRVTVDLLLGVHFFCVGRGKKGQRDRRDIKMRLDDRRGGRHRHVGMNIDGRCCAAVFRGPDARVFGPQSGRKAKSRSNQLSSLLACLMSWCFYPV